MIELHLTHDKRYDEIADLLGVPQGTVSSYIKRARERLKTAIKDFLIIFAIISALFASLYMERSFSCSYSSQLQDQIFCRKFGG
jgi:predicted transcriptional regulator